jgi:hypothetical protein
MKNYISLIAVLLIFVMCACNESTTNNNYYTTDSGNMVGKVYSIDEGSSGNKYCGGVTVWLWGTKYKTISDSTGSWTLKSVPQGIYDVYYSKPGYDTTISFSHQFPTNNYSYYSSTIYEIPKANLVLDSITVSDKSNSSYFYFNLYGHSDKNTRVTYFVDTTENVSYINRISNQSQSSNSQIFKLKDWSISKSDGIKNGQKIYITAYPGYCITETDYENGSLRYYNWGKQSNVLSLTVKY